MKPKPWLYFTAVFIIGSILFLSFKTKFSFNQEEEGLFLFKGEGGKWLEIADDLEPEDTDRLLWALPTTILKRKVHSRSCSDPAAPCLAFEWDEKYGHGFIKNVFPDGRKLVVNLGRFKDSNGVHSSGLFVGGGLPPSDPDYNMLDKNETGMAFFDGQRWYHIWCNVNEGVSSISPPHLNSYPGNWNFIGSRVLENNGHSLTIASKHRVMIDGIPFDFDRFLFYEAGKTFITLMTTFTNVGKTSASFVYSYGDEPWLGKFGSSRGNVGWYRDGLLFHEKNIDTSRYSYLGMFDYGNELAGEGHDFTRKANFIEWESGSRPGRAYLSNGSNGVDNVSNPALLTSPASRFIGLNWWPITLAPRQSFRFVIAVGMADNDPKTGFPVMPDTGLNH